MANYCTNTIVLYGQNRLPLKTLEEHIQQVMAAHDDVSSFKQLLCSLHLEKKVRHLDDWRHYLTYCWPVQFKNGVYYLRVETESAWCSMADDFELLLDCPLYQDLNLVYTSEEIGSGIFVNTDTYGLFLTDRYRFHYCFKHDQSFEDMYFASWEELLDFVAKEFPRITVTRDISDTELLCRLYAAYAPEEPYFIIDYFEENIS